ncbi:MAG: hypothetical protein JXB26_15365 [Candidatus Aminicenantes bacterium]|nr:hypothetical protein [Candidatus Aminicenantes bacterium]
MEEQKPISFGEWFLTLLIAIVPILNIVMLFIWGFGSNTHPSKATWAKASLAWIAVAVVFYIVVLGAILGIGFHFLNR